MKAVLVGVCQQGVACGSPIGVGEDEKGVGTGSESGKTREVWGCAPGGLACSWFGYRPNRAPPWVPGVPGTTVVVVPGGCGWVVGVWEVAAPLGPRSESGKTIKGWVPGFPARRWSGGFLNSGVVVGGCFRSLGFARDDSKRVRDDIGGLGWTVGHCANRAYPGPARAPWVPGVPGTTNRGVGTGSSSARRGSTWGCAPGGLACSWFGYRPTRAPPWVPGFPGTTKVRVEPGSWSKGVVVWPSPPHQVWGRLQPSPTGEGERVGAKR